MKVTFSLIIQVSLIYTMVQLFTGCTTMSPLSKAAKGGDIVGVQTLIKDGANVNEEEQKTGWTPVHSAAYSCNTEVIKLLVEKGASIDRRDKDGCLPLMFAVWSNCLGSVKYEV
jgi:ankyrin repeat protein